MENAPIEHVMDEGRCNQQLCDEHKEMRPENV